MHYFGSRSESPFPTMTSMRCSDTGASPNHPVLETMK
jgi:hypothetical protein